MIILKSQIRKRHRAGYLFVLPASIVVLLVNIYPLLRGFYLSFTNSNALYPDRTKFVGFENIGKVLFEDKEFWSVIGFTFFYAISTVICVYIISLVLALFVNQPFRGKSVIRALYLLPWVVPSVVAVNSWSWILNGQFGFINTTLMQLGLIQEPILFLATPLAAQLTSVLVGTWKNFPFMMMVLIGAMQAISPDLYESAHIDGASAFQRFRYITMPMIKQVSVVSTVLMMIWNFNNFDIVYLLTKGGPGRATMNISIYTYNMAFYRQLLGYASAIAVVMMVIMFIMSYVYRRLLRDKD